MDPTLLTIYALTHYAHNSYTSALQYLFRARAVDPTNPLILLLISLCYFHGVLKLRSETSRHMDILQGWAVFAEYADARMRWAAGKDSDGEEGWSNLVKREVEVNKARVWLMLGMGDMAVRTLERLLDEAKDEDRMDVDSPERSKEWEKEAAYALANTYASNGDTESARMVVERYLVVE